MRKGKVKAKLQKKYQILIKNHCHSKRPPLSTVSVAKIVKKVMNGEDCNSFNIEINLVNNRVIKRINRKFLNHNYFTDVIAFPYQVCSSKIEGEIFISLDEVKRNSMFYSASFKEEFTRILIHGCLHLAGYEDLIYEQKELIRKKENFYMNGIGRGK